MLNVDRLRSVWSRIPFKWKALYSGQLVVTGYLLSQRIDWAEERKTELQQEQQDIESGQEHKALQEYLQRREQGRRKDLE